MDVMGKALYRKYRSKTLDEVIGQKHVTDILAAALKKGKVSHAYLFTGPRGVGKTSVARILAHEINSLPYTDEDQHLDIIEIDAASNNGVDDIRNLREKVMIAPTSAKKKVYIIDEVHMLSKPAFNALLKTLEEPPEHVVFIMATTDVHKIPATIISRSQQFAFKFLSTDDMVKHLQNVASEEGIKINKDALELIARKGGGSARDSISLLDQISSVLSEGEIGREDAERALGLASEELLHGLLSSHTTGNTAGTIKLLHQVLETGSKPETIAEQLMKYIIYDINSQLELLPLLDKLPEVAKSSYPEVKLLTILASNNAPSGSSKKDHVKPPETATRSERSASPAIPSSETESEEPEDENVQRKEQGSSGEEANAQEFSWDVLLEDIKANRPAIYTILSKCGYILEGGTLKIYAKNKLWKNKLDTAAFRKRVADAGGAGLEVSVLARTKPTGNGAIDAVADIMGGGEEVEVDAD
jgi:DNA polymerase-3 subunit gamma/tau